MTAGASGTELPVADGPGALAIVTDEVKVVGYCSLKDSIISSNRSSAEEDKLSRTKFRAICKA